MTSLHLLHGDELGGCEVLCLGAMREEPDALLAMHRSGGALSSQLLAAAGECASLPKISWRRPFSSLDAALALRRRFGRKPVERVFLWHGRRQLLLTLMSLRLAGMRVPIIVHVGTVIERTKVSEKIQLWIAERLGFLRNVSLVAPSPAVLDSIALLQVPCPSHLIENGVRRPELSQVEFPRRLVMIARFDDSKDQSLLIRAFARLRLDYSDLRLVLIGDGPLRDEAEREAQTLQVHSWIDWTGWDPDPWRRVSLRDIFVFAVHPREGFGLALAEAVLAGLPVVASDTPAAAKFLDCGVKTYPPGDEAGLVHAVNSVLMGSEGSTADPPKLEGKLMTMGDMLSKYCRVPESHSL
jgi:glycosyltransferase involved in cell wall biosynthesis